MSKTKDWNKRLQEVLEKNFRREASQMAKWPGGIVAIGYYSDRLNENRKKFESGETA